jgi:hypothetical protein
MHANARGSPEAECSAAEFGKPRLKIERMVNGL